MRLLNARLPQFNLRAIWFSDFILKLSIAAVLFILLLFRFLMENQMDSITKNRLLIGGYEMMICLEERRARKQMDEPSE